MLAEWTGLSRTPSKPVDFPKKNLWRRYKCPEKNGTPCCDTCHCSRIAGACVLLSPSSRSPWLSPVPGPHSLRNGRAVQPHGNHKKGENWPALFVGLAQSHKQSRCSRQGNIADGSRSEVKAASSASGLQAPARTSGRTGAYEMKQRGM